MTSGPVTSGPRPAGFGPASHLVGRFFGSLWPGGPSPGDEEWACSWLVAGEQVLWRRMSGPDRRHAVAVARRAHHGGGEDRAVMAAALLHDVGKVESGLGPWRRAGATVLAMVLGRERAARSDGRLGRYLRHDRLGAALLAAAGSDPLTVAWAGQHHLPAERWTVPRPIGTLLKAADDD